MDIPPIQAFSGSYSLLRIMNLEWKVYFALSSHTDSGLQAYCHDTQPDLSPITVPKEDKMQPQNPCSFQSPQETNFWPAVKAILEKPETKPEPEVSCPDCYGDIAIRGLPSQTPNPWELAEGSQKVGVVFPCAHSLCQDRCDAHIDRLGSQNLPLTCPVCRLQMHHEGCGHMITPKRLPIASYENADMVPLTLVEMPEGNDGLPAQCLPCLRTTALTHLSWSLSHVTRFVRPSCDDAHGQWDLIAGRVQVMVTSFVDNQKMGPHWEYMASSDVSLGVVLVDDVDTIGVLPPEIRYSAGDKIIVVPDNEACWLAPCARSIRQQ